MITGATSNQAIERTVDTTRTDTGIVTEALTTLDRPRPRLTDVEEGLERGRELRAEFFHAFFRALWRRIRDKT